MSNPIAYRSESGKPSVSNLARLATDLRPEPVARIRRPQVAKQRFSRTAREAALQDGVDTRTVTVRRTS